MNTDKFYEIDFINENGILETLKIFDLVSAIGEYNRVIGVNLCVWERKEEGLSMRMLRSSKKEINSIESPD